MLAVKNLSKSFGTQKAVDNVNFCLHKGEVVILLGANGAGKTTLMRLISGYYRPDEGSICINHKDICSQRVDALRDISYVPETAALYPEMTVYEYLHSLAGLRGMKHQNFVDNLVSIIREMGLQKVINSKNDALSKGFRRRVAIAGALLSRPQILLLDEPTEGLDPNQKFAFRRLIKEYGRNNTVIISTHIMEEVEAVAGRVLMLNKGKLVRDTTPAELKKLTPQQDIESAFRAISDNN